VASLIELPFNNGKRLSAVRKLLGFRLISGEHLAEEAIKIGYPPISWRVGLYH
jgi:hypothetical protein